MASVRSVPLSSPFEEYRKHGDKLVKWREWNRAETLIDLHQKRRSRRQVVYVIRELAEDLTRCESLLDVGCGSGLLLQYLRERFGYDKASGIDPSPDAVALCQTHGIQCKQKNIYQLGVERPSFDGVLLMEVLEHLQWPERALEIAGRVARRHLWVTTPLVGWTKGRKGRLPLLSSEFHMREWTQESLVDFCLGVLTCFVVGRQQVIRDRTILLRLDRA